MQDDSMAEILLTRAYKECIESVEVEVAVQGCKECICEQRVIDQIMLHPPGKSPRARNYSCKMTYNSIENIYIR